MYTWKADLNTLKPYFVVLGDCRDSHVLSCTESLTNWRPPPAASMSPPGCCKLFGSSPDMLKHFRHWVAALTVPVEEVAFRVVATSSQACLTSHHQSWESFLVCRIFGPGDSSLPASVWLFLFLWIFFGEVFPLQMLPWRKWDWAYLPACAQQGADLIGCLFWASFMFLELRHVAPVRFCMLNIFQSHRFF